MVFICVLVTSIGVIAQDGQPKKKKKPAGQQTEAKAHQKPTKDQIRKFNELQKKQQP